MTQNAAGPTDEQRDVYHNQTATLSWLRELGHRVDYTRDPAIPSMHLAPRWSFIGLPCPYCEWTMTKRGPLGVTRDHKHPRSKGGRLTHDNRLVVCATCNEDKRDYSLYQWFLRLATGGDPRSRIVGKMLGLLSSE